MHHRIRQLPWLCGLACMTAGAAAPFQLRSVPPGAIALGAGDLIGYTADAHSLYLNYEAQGRLLRVRDELCGMPFVVDLAAGQRYPGRFLCTDAKAPPSGAFIDLRRLEGARLDIQWGGKDPDRRRSPALEAWLGDRQLLYRRHRVGARCLRFAPTNWRRAAVHFDFALDGDSELGPQLSLTLYFDGAPAAGAVLAALGVGIDWNADCTRQRLRLTLDVQQAPSRHLQLVEVAPLDP